MHRSRRLRNSLVCLVVAGLSAVALGVVTTSSATGASSPMPTEKQWRQDVAQVMTGSQRYLRRTIAGGHRRYAINLDIDNTSLATYYRRGTAVIPVRALARYAHRHGVAVLFNTARSGSKVQVGRRMLRQAGYPITEMCGRARPTEALATGKRLCRAHFIREGYTIVANVGNNATDFAGPRNYGRAFRLPNYGGRLG